MASEKLKAKITLYSPYSRKGGYPCVDHHDVGPHTPSLLMGKVGDVSLYPYGCFRRIPHLLPWGDGQFYMSTCLGYSTQLFSRTLI